jgi:L-threonylcarbamoyladenylate synthase
MPQLNLHEFVEKARSGDCLVSFPTDTVPALAAQPDRADLIFAAKQRSFDKPLILMAGAIADLLAYVAGSPPERAIWQSVAERYLPGAVTLVLPASDRVPTVMNPKDPTTIGVRVPQHAAACAILRQTGPLATTSVNRSGQPALLTMIEIEQQFPQILTLTTADLNHLGGELTASGVPSTVIRWRGDRWEVLRQGVVMVDV